MSTIDELWQNKDYREQMASAYLASVLQDEVELTNANLHLIKSSCEILLHED